MADPALASKLPSPLFAPDIDPMAEVLPVAEAVMSNSQRRAVIWYSRSSTVRFNTSRSFSKVSLPPSKMLSHAACAVWSTSDQMPWNSARAERWALSCFSRSALAVAASRAIYDQVVEGAPEGIELFHGYTYSGHPLAAAAGLATLDIYRDEGLETALSEADLAARPALDRAKWPATAALAGAR